MSYNITLHLGVTLHGVGLCPFHQSILFIVQNVWNYNIYFKIILKEN